MFITRDDLEYALKSVTGKDKGAGLNTKWQECIDAALNFGYGEIVTAFASRGFTKAQIDQWDRGAEFQRDLGLFHLLREGKAVDPSTYDPEAIRDLDRRKDLLLLGLTIDGVWQDPASDVGQARTGSFDTSGDMFVEDIEDTRRGQPTRW